MHAGILFWRIFTVCLVYLIAEREAEFTFSYSDKRELAIPLIKLRRVHSQNFRPRYSGGVSEVRSRRGNWNLSWAGGEPWSKKLARDSDPRRNPAMATQSRRLWPTSYRSFLLLRLHHLPSSFPLETIILIPYILFKRPALSKTIFSPQCWSYRLTCVTLWFFFISSRIFNWNVKQKYKTDP